MDTFAHTCADVVLEGLGGGEDDALVGRIPLDDAVLPVHAAIQHDAVALQSNLALSTFCKSGICLVAKPLPKPILRREQNRKLTLELPMNCWQASICWCTSGFVGARNTTLPCTAQPHIASVISLTDQHFVLQCSPDSIKLALRPLMGRNW